MSYSKQLVCLLLLAAGLSAEAQEKKAMTFEQMVEWKRISAQSISDDGNWVSCKTEPWKGDATLHLYNRKGDEKATFCPASKGEFSPSSQYLLVTRVPSLRETDSLKLRKTKAENMPMNRLDIYQLSGQTETIDSLKSYKLSEVTDLLAYQRGSKADSLLYIRTLDGKRQDSFPAVTEFGFAKKGNVLYYISDSLLYTYTPEKGSHRITDRKGVFSKVSFNEKGTKLAYLYCTDKDSVATRSALYVANENSSPQLIAEKGNPAFPVSWVVSENGTVYFSENSSRLFFGTAPAPKQKDSTMLAENRPDVQIWKWDEGVQYTQQVYNKASNLKRTYTAVYNLNNRQLFQLATEELPILITADEGNASFALLASSKGYETEQMWEGRTRYDLYTVNLETGHREQFRKAGNTLPRLSPKGKYAYWYQEQDSSWYTRSMKDGREYRLTTPQTFAAWDEDNDVPDYPSPYGLAGWTDNDEYLLLRDRYDIYQFSPTAAFTPINLTVNGRTEQLSYSLVRLDKEKKSVDLKEEQLLMAFNEKTKGFGYYSAHFSAARPTAPQTLLAGNFMLSTPVKAKQANTLLYTRETFEQYPDLHLTDLSFRNSVQLTHGDSQQQEVNWGTAELVNWISLDGCPLEGIVYKPANFDPAKKYPMIVNFYERNAETLYSYRMPEPHRSTIDYHFYTSNGYIVFNPDVRYTDGYPGESCYNCVMPGITSLIAKGYINEKAIAAQGHSWGGYQVAYLATRTNLFAAIESGAPVVNMLSAYGGIRWGSGLNRSFQYEHGQSRIGGTIWDMPMQYIENSPLFTMDKVTTPILIMHNDNDGHVPWYQGIEYFIALKRLQKPVWLLNYPGEPHWPMRLANRIDFQKRMYQFFDHYLRQTPMPTWMSEGVPAVDQEFELGYE